MVRTRLQKRNHTPKFSEFLEEVKEKARQMNPPEEVVIQKPKFVEFKIPRVRLRNAHERILNAPVEHEMTPLQEIHTAIKNGDAKRALRQTVIVIDDD